jgi:hypothetical protein
MGSDDQFRHHRKGPSWLMRPSADIPKQIGEGLRRVYEPPKDLPPELATLLRQLTGERGQ